MDVRAVIFDLDGTLLDTLDDLHDAVNLSLERRGYGGHDRDRYRIMVGNGMRRLVEQALPQGARSDEEVESMVDEVNAYLAEHPVTKTVPYRGVPELLEALASKKIPMAILSNKPNALTQKVVGLLLSPFPFAVVQGQMAGVPRKPDPEAALLLARKMGSAPGETLFIGDSDVDMKTASAAGMVAVGAEWGFRGAKELEAAGARSILRAPLDLLSLLGEPGAGKAQRG